MPTPTLAIIGCGPKAVAIAAKAAVLAELGWRVPRIVAIDPRGIAANWDGTNGYTDGKILLGTSPLEDVGFPYESVLEPRSDAAMLRLSFQAYLVAGGRYAAWVDRGQPPPAHGMLAEYLRWVAAQVGLDPVIARVRRACVDSGRWAIDCEAEHGDLTVHADAVVVTGPGQPLRFPRTGNADRDSRVLDGRTFWEAPDRFSQLRDACIAVVGGGETSAAIVTKLAASVDVSTNVEVVTPHPTLFTRNEGWLEVMYFSTAAGWRDLPESARHEIIHRADRGTYSVAAKDVLNGAYNVGVRVGAATSIECGGELPVLAIATNDGELRVPYDFIIEAVGFDRLSFLDWFPDCEIEPDYAALSKRIATDLRLDGVEPPLHLPGLAAMAQGPGFPNLSCLGLLADRVLRAYTELPTPAETSHRSASSAGAAAFPDFRSVADLGRAAYEELLSDCIPCGDRQAMVPSDYLWLSVMAWCPQSEVARLDQSLCLRMPTYHGEGWLTAFLARECSPDTVRRLLLDPSLGGSLHYVPKWIAESLLDSSFEVVPDRDNFDYILDVAEQVAAEGAAYREARRRRRSFARNYPSARTDCVPLPSTSEAEVLRVFDAWVANRPTDGGPDTDDERMAVSRLLRHVDVDRCHIARLFIGTELAGFEIGEALPDGTGVSHFLKTREPISGAGDVIVDELRRAFAAIGIDRVNIEQDLGLPGLRTRKLMEKPAFLLEKYIVTLA